jgi:hypothetical protein
MKKVELTLGLLIALVAVIPLSASAQSGRDRVCVYENNYYHGWEECFAVGEQIPDLGPRRNKVSSIRLFGNAMAVVYANKDFGGATMDVTADINDMAQVPLAQRGILPGSSTVSWNDVVESMQVRSRNEPARRTDNRDYRVAPPPPPPPVDDRRSRNGVCIYEEPDFRGRAECFDSRDEISDLGRSWNDRISSLRVFGPTRITLYRDINFQGDSIRIDRDIRYLGDLRLRGSLSWDNQASSFDIDGGRGRAYGRDSRSSH